LQVSKDGNNRIAVEDLELLQKCCDICDARNILEIGSADGGSSIVLGLKAKERSGHLYCIEPVPKKRMVDNMVRYGLAGCYTIIKASSPWVGSEDVPDKIDLLFIDGRHDIRWCLVDYHYFGPQIRPGGIIVFHDYSGNCREDHRQANYGKDGYIGLVKRAVDIILQTDSLKKIGISTAKMGGAIAFQK
jgi:predicted O-methyltransferase YrrM